MGLSDDQRAMLRMVAQRGEQGYEDIAALMGLSVDEVRARVAAALAELDSEGALTGEAKAAAEQQAPTEEPPAEQPQAQEPPAPAEPAAAEPPPPPPLAAAQAPPSQPGKPPWIKLPSGTGLRAAIGAAIAVIALVAVIVIVTGGGGDGESGSATAASETAASGETASAKTEGKGGAEAKNEANQLTKAKLNAVDGSEAEGVAIFGKVKKKLALELAAQKLQPTQQGQAYTIWLSKNKQKMLPLASTRAPKGRIAAKFEIPVEVLGYLADETFTDLVLTRTEDTQLEAALEKAAKAKTTPDYTGTEVLRGKVTGPIVGAQFRLEELEELEEEEAGEKGE